jgi:hypothetical protein
VQLGIDDLCAQQSDCLKRKMQPQAKPASSVALLARRPMTPLNLV